MRFGRARDLARAWGSDLVDMGLAGHINVASGFGPWPYGKELRDDLDLRAARQFPAKTAPRCNARIAR